MSGDPEGSGASDINLESHSATTAVGTFLALCVTGGSIGWMVGLSVSPVIHGVITCLLAVMTTVAFSFSVETEPKRLLGFARESPLTSSTTQYRSKGLSLLFAMALTLSISVGATMGVYGRTHRWLGESLDTFVSKWEKTGLSDQQLATLLLESQLAGGGEDDPSSANQNQPVLFHTVGASELATLRAARGELLRRLIKGSGDERLIQFADKCKDDDCLHAAVEYLVDPGKG